MKDKEEKVVQILSFHNAGWNRIEITILTNKGRVLHREGILDEWVDITPNLEII